MAKKDYRGHYCWVCGRIRPMFGFARLLVGGSWVRTAPFPTTSLSNLVGVNLARVSASFNTGLSLSAGSYSKLPRGRKWEIRQFYYEVRRWQQEADGGARE